MGALMVLTPLGLLAVGSAWGEWSPEDFKNRESRNEIAAASKGAQPPASAPSGLNAAFNRLDCTDPGLRSPGSKKSGVWIHPFRHGRLGADYPHLRVA